MLAGGVSALGESRLENVARMRQAGVAGPFWLLRSPTPALAEETVALTDVALVSEIDVIAALDAAAARANRTYRVIAMVDVGDLREGMMPATLPAFLQRAAAFDACRDRRHRHQPHLLRHDRPHRREPRSARRARRDRRAPHRTPAHRLRRHVDDAGHVHRRRHAPAHRQPAHRRSDRPRRKPGESRAHPGTAHGCAGALGAGHRVPGEAVQTHRQSARRMRLATARSSRTGESAAARSARSVVRM